MKGYLAYRETWPWPHDSAIIIWRCFNFLTAATIGACPSTALCGSITCGTRWLELIFGSTSLQWVRSEETGSTFTPVGIWLLACRPFCHIQTQTPVTPCRAKHQPKTHTHPSPPPDGGPQLQSVGNATLVCIVYIRPFAAWCTVLRLGVHSSPMLLTTRARHFAHNFVREHHLNAKLSNSLPQ